MDQRPDEVVRRDPLGGGTPGFDPATDAFEPDAIRDPTRGRTDIDEVDVDRVEVDDVEATLVEIERTRADMSETVDAIQERLSPQNLKEQAKDKVKEATVGRAREARSGVVETIRSNPLPATLTGIGLGWLLMSAPAGLGAAGLGAAALLPGRPLPGPNQRVRARRRQVPAPGTRPKGPTAPRRARL